MTDERDNPETEAYRRVLVQLLRRTADAVEAGDLPRFLKLWTTLGPILQNGADRLSTVIHSDGRQH